MSSPNKFINPRRVQLFKNLIRAIAEIAVDQELNFHPLEMATACEEFAAEQRKKSAQDFKEEDDRTYPEWIG